MRNFIFSMLIIILSVSCASSRQELSIDKSTKVTSTSIQQRTDIMEEMLADLVAKFSDSIHFELESYYPPKNDSDSVGPLKSKLVCDKKSQGDVKKKEIKKTHKNDSIGIQHNDSTKNDVKVEEKKKSSTFKFNVFHLFGVCIVIFLIGKYIKRDE